MTKSSTNGTVLTQSVSPPSVKISEFTVLQLPENYRCPPSVVEAANKLIIYNLTRDFDKAALVAYKHGRENDVIRVETFDTFEEEADWVASDIALRPADARCESVVAGSHSETLGTDRGRNWKRTGLRLTSRYGRANSLVTR